MEQSALQKLMAEYAAKIKSGGATIKDFTDMKNAIRNTYDAGNLDKESMVEMGKKATFAFKNKDATKNLADLSDTIIEKGGSVMKDFTKADDGVLSKVTDIASGAGKKMRSFAPLMSALGKGIPLAGTIAGLASGDVFAADPTGLLQTDEVGKGSDVVGEKPSFDFSEYRTNKAVNDSPPDTSNMPSFKNEAVPIKKERTKYSDLQKMLGK